MSALPREINVEIRELVVHGDSRPQLIAAALQGELTRLLSDRVPAQVATPGPRAEHSSERQPHLATGASASAIGTTAAQVIYQRLGR